MQHVGYYCVVVSCSFKDFVNYNCAKMASKVHKIRFYNPKPQFINCVSFNKHLKLIALARGDAAIEIWDLNYAAYLTRFIPGVENGSVEALGWVGDRLLSTGLGEALVEWDIAKLTQKTSVLLTGYAAWCLDVNSASTLVAVGTEQGYVNLYSVEDNNIVYKKLFDKQEGRIICCKFDKAGNTLVTGSIDTIRVWNVETGHAITRISVSRRKKEVIVWSLAVLSDSTIVSGDSQGRLTFWDGSLGEQIESYTTQKADILSIAVSDDEKNIYCSGLDPTISHFIIVTKGSGKQSNVQWVKNVQRHIHEHDVRALVVCDNKLVSVGMDGYLTFSSYPPKWVMRVPPMIPAPRSTVCPGKKLLLLRYSNHLEVWKLGSYATNECGEIMPSDISSKQDTNQNKSSKQIEQDTLITVKSGIDNGKEKQNLKLAENPVKIVSIQTKHNRQIKCCDMSPNGEFIVYATDSDVRMLKLDTDAEEDQTSISMSKMSINGLPSVCDRVAFTDDSRTMVVHCGGGELQVLQVDPEAGASVVQIISTDKYLKSPSILHLTVSKKSTSGSTYVVVADTCGVIAVLVDKKRRFGHHVTLPKYQCVPSAMTVDSERETLIVAYVDQKILEYDLVKKKFTNWPGSALPSQWSSRQAAIVSVSVHPRRNAVVFQDRTSLWILERDSQTDDHEPETKRKPKTGTSLCLSVVLIKYLAGFHWVCDDEAVMLEVLPENIVSQLPPPVRVNKWHIRP